MYPFLLRLSPSRSSSAPILCRKYITPTVCIGIPFAERTLFINIALILWAFTIHKATDPQTGLPVPCDLTDAAFDGGVSTLLFHSDEAPLVHGDPRLLGEVTLHALADSSYFPLSF